MDFNSANEWATLLKALAHPTRLQIVAELLKSTRCVTYIQDILPASQANISQHLAVLRHAGLVNFVQDGSQRCYYVSRPRLASVVIDLLTEDESVVCKSKDDIDRENTLQEVLAVSGIHVHTSRPSKGQSRKSLGLTRRSSTGPTKILP